MHIFTVSNAATGIARKIQGFHRRLVQQNVLSIKQITLPRGLLHPAKPKHGLKWSSTAIAISIYSLPPPGGLTGQALSPLEKLYREADAIDPVYSGIGMPDKIQLLFDDQAAHHA